MCFFASSFHKLNSDQKIIARNEQTSLITIISGNTDELYILGCRHVCENCRMMGQHAPFRTDAYDDGACDSHNTD